VASSAVGIRISVTKIPAAVDAYKTPGAARSECINSVLENGRQSDDHTESRLTAQSSAGYFHRIEQAAVANPTSSYNSR